MTAPDEPNPSKESRASPSLWRKPAARWLLGIPVGGFLMFFAGVIAWGILDTAVGITNTETFCANMCHSMRAFITPEWSDSVHFENRTGVRATCADCHVPKPFVPKMKAKVLAVKDLYHEIVGTMNTREEFEARRLKMATRVWNKMRATNSGTCLGCHDIEHMAFDQQLTFQHDPVKEIGRTCIDCHKGIAHKLPTGSELGS